MKQHQKYLCIHGHFYQPPRENPWLELIEQQESAAPFHDWNDRIHYECYRPNAMSRIYDDKGKILKIVNNYEKISFNFGPTVLSWLQEKKPDTYQAILNADKASLKNSQGYGNAFAQVYNHMIMPLANYRDKVTQVIWGIKDFKFRFGRNPESIWLAETACDNKTLEVLIQQGIKYIVLAPNQAESVRSFDEDHWNDVSNGSINPKEPYRCFINEDREKYIDIFFYDGPISQAVGFEKILTDSKLFMDRLESAYDPHHKGPQLIHIATDGETYGHHKPYGDRVLAYLLQEVAPEQGYQIVNYAQFLELCPPKKEVRLKSGEDGEGTAWSCAHGVRRWKENCGCRGDGPATWNQEWRKPLRDSLDWLRDQLIELFETEASRYLKDVWEARNDYISIILNRNSGSIKSFFEKHAVKELTQNETCLSLQLLEMQRHAMLMYTSCGWFFTELSGLETVQILHYAARAIQLAERIKNRRLEDEFLKWLENAKSNIPEVGDGKSIYLNQVKPHIAYLSNVAGYYAITSILKDFTEEELKSFFCLNLDVQEHRKESLENITLNFGRIKVSSKITLSEEDFIFAGIQHGPYDFHCFVIQYTDQKKYEAIEKELFESLYTSNVVDHLKIVEKHFAENKYQLKDLPLEWRTQLINNASKETLEHIHKVYEELFEEYRNLPTIYKSVNVPIPPELKYISEVTLGNRVETVIRNMEKKGFLKNKSKQLDTFKNIGKSLGIELNKNSLKAYLGHLLDEKILRFYKSPNEVVLSEILNILDIAEQIKVTIDKTLIQDYLYLILKDWGEKESTTIKELPVELREKTLTLAKKAGFNTASFNELLRK